MILNDLISGIGYEKMLEDIKNDYIPTKGVYIKLNLNNPPTQESVLGEIATNEIPSNIEPLLNREMYSGYLNSNKAVVSAGTTQKVIISSNYLSLFFNMPTLIKNAEKYKMTLSNYLIKCAIDYLEQFKKEGGMYSKCFELFPRKEVQKKLDTKITSTKELQEAQEALIKKYVPEVYNIINDSARDQEINKIKEYFEKYSEDIISLIEKIDKYEKKKIKIFINITEEETPIDKLQEESDLYLYPNVFISNDYNKISNDKLVGFHSFNTSINTKKPYLLFKAGNEDLMPVYVTIEDAKKYYYLSQYLRNIIKKGKRNFSIEVENGAFDLKTDIDNDIPIIISIEFIPFKIKNDDTISFKYKNILRLKNKDGELIEYTDITSMDLLEKKASQLLFNSKMPQHLQYKDVSLRKDTSILVDESFSSGMMDAFEKYKLPLWNYFKLQIPEDLKKIITNLVNRIIYEYMTKITKKVTFKNENGKMQIKIEDLQYYDIANTINFGLSLVDFIEGGNGMSESIENNIESMHDILLGGSMPQNDAEFYFLTGQIAMYVTALREKSGKKQSLLNKIIKSSSVDKLRKFIIDDYTIVNYKISLYSEVINNAMKAFSGYIPQSTRLNMDNKNKIMVGIASENLIFKLNKSKKNIIKNEEEK